MNNRVSRSFDSYDGYRVTVSADIVGSCVPAFRHVVTSCPMYTICLWCELFKSI